MYSSTAVAGMRRRRAILTNRSCRVRMSSKTFQRLILSRSPGLLDGVDECGHALVTSQSPSQPVMTAMPEMPALAQRRTPTVTCGPLVRILARIAISASERISSVTAP